MEARRYGVSASLFVLLLAVFVPPIALLSLLLHARWVRREFVLFRPPSERSHAGEGGGGGVTATPGASAAAGVDSGSDGAAAAARGGGSDGGALSRCWRGWTGGDHRSRPFLAACARGGLPREDYATLAAFAGLAGCLLAFALLLWALWPSVRWVGPVLAASYVVLGASAWGASGCVT